LKQSTVIWMFSVMGRTYDAGTAGGRCPRRKISADVPAISVRGVG
jgi:hypothetical protein